MLVRFFQTASGQSPVEKYIAGLDSRERALVLEALAAIQSSGFEGVTTRQIKGKLWEVKVSQQRLFYVVVSGPEMIVVHACKKQGQKARKSDLEIATKRVGEVK